MQFHAKHLFNFKWIQVLYKLLWLYSFFLNMFLIYMVYIHKQCNVESFIHMLSHDLKAYAKTATVVFAADIQENIGQMELDVEHAIEAAREADEKRKKPGETCRHMPHSMPRSRPLDIPHSYVRRSQAHSNHSSVDNIRNARALALNWRHATVVSFLANRCCTCYK